MGPGVAAVSPPPSLRSPSCGGNGRIETEAKPGPSDQAEGVQGGAGAMVTRPLFQAGPERIPPEGACPGGGQGAPHSIRGSPLPVGAARGRFWRLAAQGGAPADSPLGVTVPLPASEAPRSLREAEHFPGLGGGRCCPHPLASGLLSRGRPLPAAHNLPSPTPRAPSQVQAARLSLEQAFCPLRRPLAWAGVIRVAPGSRGRGTASPSGRPALTQLPGRWAPMWPSPSPGSLSTVVARRALPRGVGPQVPPPKARPTEGPGPPSGLLGHHLVGASVAPDPNHPP
ncbi:basic proline-rich protein-like [Phocoena phocoena]|uniref:basic proline-rich protein-like n=1 Tax=Phocoena phocoena TaxID=9742 RepID=UPI00330734A8